MEQAFGKVERFYDLRIVFPRFRADHAAGGGIGVLVGFHPREPVQEVFRDHKEVRDAVQPPGFLIRI